MRTYGGTGVDAGHSVQQVSDGGYVIVGSTCSFGSGGMDVYLIKTDSHGETLWTRTFGGNGDDCGYSLQQCRDGGYVIVGYTTSFGAGDKDLYLIRTNANGDTLWTRTLGGAGRDEGWSVRQIVDGGYVMAGQTTSFGADTDDVFLAKTDSLGDTLWTKTFGGADQDEGYSVQQTTDGGYIVVGFTLSFGTGSGDVYLVKTDTRGDTLWTRTIGGTGFDCGWSVQQTVDSSYLVAGQTNSRGAGSSDVYLVRTNSHGDTLWTRTFGDVDYDCGYLVKQTPDGGAVVAGMIRSASYYTWDVCLIRTDANGDSLWSKTFGGADDDWGNSVGLTDDSGFAVAGYTGSYGAGGDVYLIKTDSLGNAAGLEEPLTRHPARPSRFLARPNPFTSFARVPGHETEHFVLSDVTGRQVSVCKGDRVGAGLRPGVYFLSPVGSRAGKVPTATIVKTAF
jgi:hypothetical protein